MGRYTKDDLKQVNSEELIQILEWSIISESDDAIEAEKLAKEEFLERLMNNKTHWRLEAENELLKADNAILKSKWELQGLMIQKLHKEIKELNQEIGEYSGSIQAITEEFNFIIGRLALVNTKMLEGGK